MPAAAKTATAAVINAPKSNPLIEWIIPIAAVSLVFVMLVPLPAMALDLLLATSFAASVLVLLSALQILRPAQFSVFPSLLLLLTLFRLSLNLASSRRILLHGNEGAGAAGRVIEAFGQFVVGGNYIVGFVLFLALIAIQYIVVSHGAVRTAEVTARFTLDALPGKQMAIDADLNAGLIDEHQARARREQTAREAEFYGAMDGAARFNQRDSIATILITGINILAGFLIGVFQLDIPFSRGAQDLHRAHRRRRVGHAHPLVAGVDGEGHGGHPRVFECDPLRRSRHPATLPPPVAANRRWRYGRARLHPRPAEVFLSHGCRRRHGARLAIAKSHQR
jgi:flagellar biosynthesis protein FlhA